MSSKKKHKKGHTHKQEASPHYPSPSVELIPSRHGQKEVQPYPFPTKFKEVLRVSSPAVPPGLLKLHTKRTDGKVGFTSVNVSKSKSKYRYVGKIVLGHHANSKIIINKTILEKVKLLKTIKKLLKTPKKA